MKYFMKSLLIIGIVVGGVVALFEYFGRGPAATATPATSPTSWVTILHSFFSSPWALLSIAALGFFVLLAISVWRKTGEAAGGFFWNKETNDLTPFGRLLAVIAFVMWFIFAVNYVHGEPWINNFFFGISERERWVIVVILVALAHLPLSPLANFIVPTKGAFMRAVVYATFVVVIAYAGSRVHTTHDFFNPKTGDPAAYIDPTTNKPYRHGGYAPDTGEKLVPITKEMAQKLKKQSPINLAKQKVDGLLKDVLSEPSLPPQSSPPPPPKEEKKVIAAKGKRWREAMNGESGLPSTYPFGRWSITLNRGERFDIPPMGEGSCSAIFVERGGIETRLFDREGREFNGSRLIANTQPSTNCNNHLIKIVATQDGTRLKGGACRAPNKWCLVYE